LTIALDATYSTGRNLSGVGVYCREILSGLARSHPGEQFRWCYRPHRLRQALLQARTEPRPANVSLRPLLERWQVFGAGLFHGLNQRLPSSRFRHTVCTFHDLFVMTSEYSTAEFRKRFAHQARSAASRADIIICVSSFTASQVHELLGVEHSRLRVIPHGTVLPEETPSTREPIVLHVGAVQLRKNLSRLVAAFERAAPPPWRLVLAGADGFGAASVHERIAASPVADRIETPGWVDDATLEALYRRASIFAFPSLDEGFGIPVLEAMAHGLPVLSSNRSALPEACGDAAILVDPFSEEEIAEGLRRLVEDGMLRGALISAGRARAAAFPWSRAAEETWKVYAEVSGRVRE